MREHRAICVHKEDDTYYVTPQEKVGDEFEDMELVDVFEPSEEVDDLERVPIESCANLSVGDRVVVNREEVRTVTEVTSRQVVLNTGDAFRKSDCVLWGGGDRKITDRIEEKD